MLSDIWNLPEKTEIDGYVYRFHGDYRDILEIFSYLTDPDLPDFIKWKVGLKLFYEEPVRPAHVRQAMEYLSFFIRCGQPEIKNSAVPMLDWQQDGPMIVADINKVAGTEIRRIPFLHWWTFMAWFHEIGEGQLSSVLNIRRKLGQGKRLEKWEQEYYRENRQQIDLHRKYSREDLAQQDRLKKILDAADVSGNK